MEDINSDLSILHEDYDNVDQNVTMCGEMSDVDIIAQLKENNQTEDGPPGEEIKEMQEKPLFSAVEAVVHINELRCFFEGQSNVEDYAFVSIHRMELYAKTQRLHSNKQSKISDFYFKNDE